MSKPSPPNAWRSYLQQGKAYLESTLRVHGASPDEVRQVLSNLDATFSQPRWAERPPDREKNPKAYLARAAKNELLKVRKKEQPSRVSLDDQAGEGLAPTTPARPGAVLDGNRIYKEIAKLPVRTQLIFWTRLHRLPDALPAAWLGLSTVRIQHIRNEAKKQLQAALREFESSAAAQGHYAAAAPELAATLIWPDGSESRCSFAGGRRGLELDSEARTRGVIRAHGATRRPRFGLGYLTGLVDGREIESSVFPLTWDSGPEMLAEIDTRFASLSPPQVRALGGLMHWDGVRLTLFCADRGCA